MGATPLGQPDPVAFLRLAASASLLRDGMAQRDLLPAADRDTLDTFIELATWLGGVATRELGVRVVNDKQNERLGGIGWRSWSTCGSPPRTSSRSRGIRRAGEESDALVADIYRSSAAYLEEATGFVDTIWVIVPIADGRFELARGAVSSYYEFRWPADGSRLTDKEWRSMLDDGTRDGSGPVERPSWQAPFLLGARIADEPVPQAEPRWGAARRRGTLARLDGAAESSWAGSARSFLGQIAVGAGTPEAHALWESPGPMRCRVGP